MRFLNVYYNAKAQAKYAEEARKVTEACALGTLGGRLFYLAFDDEKKKVVGALWVDKDPGGDREIVVAVHPDYQRQGIGSLLTDAAGHHAGRVWGRGLSIEPSTPAGGAHIRKMMTFNAAVTEWGPSGLFYQIDWSWAYENGKMVED